MFGAPKPPSQEKEDFSELVHKIEAIAQEKKDSVFLPKLIRVLREDNRHAAAVFINNESDKFRSYGNDLIMLLIQDFYKGSGSPWFTAERKLKEQK